MAKKPVSFEQALSTLEDAVTQLESGQLPLDEALDCFETGVKSANVCRKQLRRVEAKVETLMKNADGAFSCKQIRTDEVEE